MNRKEILRRLGILRDYQLTLYRIGEASDAADREEMRVMTAISKLQAMLKDAPA